MKILDFYKEFPDEASCKASFKEYRLQQGVFCKRCQSTEHYWKTNRSEWQCKKCGTRTTLKSGTVMENSKLPYQYWFAAMHLITTTKKSFSACEMQRQLGHKRYEPIWMMLHKIRSIMGLRDNKYQLKGEVELDDGFFATVSINRNKEEQLKRGRGSQKQTTVLVCVESKKMGNQELHKKYSTNKKLGFIKMKVLHSLKKELTTSVVEKTVEKGSKINSDGSNSYNGLSKNYNHHPQVVAPKDASKMLPWVHKAISNAKRLLLDVHHRIDDSFLENYLNEYCYKLNRRYFPNLFDRLMKSAVTYRWNSFGESGG